MGDTRTLREKLEAMASQSASPREAAIARRKLSQLKPRATLTRGDILSTPDGPPIRIVRFYDQALGAWVVADAQDHA